VVERDADAGRHALAEAGPLVAEIGVAVEQLAGKVRRLVELHRVIERGHDRELWAPADLGVRITLPVKLAVGSKSPTSGGSSCGAAEKPPGSAHLRSWSWSPDGCCERTVRATGAQQPKNMFGPSPARTIRVW
jgi:hypothetical protein